MDKIFNFPYNFGAVARLDSNNIVHNHIYHECPVGKVGKNNIIYNKNNYPVGRVDKNGVIHNHPLFVSPVGKVEENGFVYKNGLNIAKMDGDNILAAGGAYLLLIHELR